MMTQMVLGAVLSWAVLIITARRHTGVNNVWNVLMVSAVLAAMTVFSIATARDKADRPVYTREFLVMDKIDSPIDSLGRDGDPLFNLFLWSLSHLAPAREDVLYGVVTAVALVGFIAAARLLMPSWAALAAFITVIAMGLFTAYASVAIRQGLAAACLLVAVALVSTQRPTRILWALLLAASLLHWTAIPLAVGLIVLRWRTPSLRSQVIVWVALAVLFILGASQRMITALGIPVPNVAEYTNETAFASYGSEGARLDFLAVSAVILLLALWGNSMVPADDQYTRLIATFVMFNSAFLLLGFVAYSDRIAAYSWFVAPLLLWYPLAQREGRSPLPAVAMVSILAVGFAIGTLSALAA